MSHRRAAGFTLIELIVVVALISIMLALAVPSFTQFISSNRVTGATNEFLHGVSQTRIETLKRGKTMAMLPLDKPPRLGGVPSLTTGKWNFGWAVCELDSLATPTGCKASTIFVSQHDELASSTVATDPSTSGQAFTDANGRTYVAFDGTGYPRTLQPLNGTRTGGIVFTDTMGSKTNQRTLCVALLGAPRIIQGATTCP